LHREVSERIRIIRRLDFVKPHRIRATYVEHAQILRHILRRHADSASLLLRSHITASKAEVRKITLHMMYEARHAQAASEGSVESGTPARTRPSRRPAQPTLRQS